MNHSLLVSCHVEPRKKRKKELNQTKLVHLISVSQYVCFVYNKMKNKNATLSEQF